MKTMAEIISAIRREIREPNPLTVSDTEIEDHVLEGMNFLWDTLVMADSSLAIARGILHSYSNEHALPTDFDHIKQVKDPMRKGYFIASVTIGDPTLVTVTNHPYSDGDQLIVHGIKGIGALTTETTDGEDYLNTKRLNGLTHTVTVSGDNITIPGVKTAGTWENSTGTVIKFDTNYRKLEEISQLDSYKRHKYAYYLTGNTLVRDKEDYYQSGEYQWLVIDYIRRPSWKIRTGGSPNFLMDIPKRFHYSLESYGVIRSMRLPTNNQELAKQLGDVLAFHQNQWDKTLGVISGSTRSSAPQRFRDNIHWDSLY